MTLDDVKNYLKENADKDDVKAYLTELSKPSADIEAGIIEAYKKSREYTSELDRSVSKAVESHDAKIKPKLEEEIRRRVDLEKNPPKTAREIENEERIAKLEAINENLAKEARKNKYQAALPKELHPIFEAFNDTTLDDEGRIKTFQKVWRDIEISRAPQPGKSSGGTANARTYTREQLRTMTPEQINKARLEGAEFIQ